MISILMLSMPQKQSEAAAAQDKFWEMHDYPFEHQKALDDSHLLQYAKKVPLDDVWRVLKLKVDCITHYLT
jgi:protein-disulfide isomerase